MTRTTKILMALLVVSVGANAWQGARAVKTRRAATKNRYEYRVMSVGAGAPMLLLIDHTTGDCFTKILLGHSEWQRHAAPDVFDGAVPRIAFDSDK